jgi:hypothetical protein
VKLQVLKAARMKMAVFWTVVPYSLAEVYNVAKVLLFSNSATALTEAAIFIVDAVRT